MHTRGVNVNYRRRIRQVIVLVFTIIIGVLLSQATQAQGCEKNDTTKVITVK